LPSIFRFAFLCGLFCDIIPCFELPRNLPLLKTANKVVSGLCTRKKSFLISSFSVPVFYQISLHSTHSTAHHRMKERKFADFGGTWSE